MKKILFFTFLILISSCSIIKVEDDLNELSPTLQWYKSIRQSDIEIIPDNRQAFTLTTDDKILILTDTAMLQYSEAGEYINAIAFNHSLSAIKRLDTGGYLMIGNETPNLVVTKLDANLNQEWQQNHFVGNLLIPNGIAILDDAYFISGLLGNNSWIFKLDPNGGLTWEKHFERSGSEIISTIKATTDNHIIAIGQINSTDVNDLQGDFDVWTFKINTDGTTVWETILGGSGTDEGRDINENIDGNYTILASSNSNTGDFESIEDFESKSILVKLDTNNGNITAVNGITGNLYSKLAIQDTNDEIFLIAEDKINIFNAENTIETVVTKVDVNSDRIWQMNLGYSSYGESPFAAMKTSDNGLIVMSNTLTDYDGYLIYKINPEN